MIQRDLDPIRTLHGALECLLIGFQYEASRGSLELVLDHRKNPGVDRTFWRVLFEGVVDFKRHPGTFAELQSFAESYAAREHRAAVVLESVRINERGQPLRVSLGFGHSFGGIEFGCDSLRACFRNALASRGEGENVWHYRDADDDTPLDFYEPFR